MSNTHTMRAPERVNLAASVIAGARAAWRRWQQHDRLRAQQRALRRLDRRTLQDLGLYDGADASSRAGPLASDYERLRW